jgi:hypothetical protein
VRDTVVLPIDEELVRRLQITEDNWVIQEETENGILITIPPALKPKRYKPVFSPISAAAIHKISIPNAAAYKPLA